MEGPALDPVDLRVPTVRIGVPVSELETRQRELARRLREAGLPGFSSSTPSTCTTTPAGVKMARSSCRRKVRVVLGTPAATDLLASSVEAYDVPCTKQVATMPRTVAAFPSLRAFGETLRERGVSEAPALQLGEIPSSFAARFSKALSGWAFAVTALASSMPSAVKIRLGIGVHGRGRWGPSPHVRSRQAVGGEGVSELDLVAAAEAVSRCEGFAGRVEMSAIRFGAPRRGRFRALWRRLFLLRLRRWWRWPPLSGMGAGFAKVKVNEPVLVDLVPAWLRG